MNPAIATVIAAAVGVVGIVLGSIVSALLNRGKDSADTAQKISDAWDPVFDRMDKELQRVTDKCSRCEEKLGKVNDRLSARDDATYKLLEILDTALTPTLPAVKRVLVQEAMDNLRRIMRGPT